MCVDANVSRERVGNLVFDYSASRFIDEMHTLIRAGKTDGAMDASNMLKPALVRGELHCIRPR